MGCSPARESFLSLWSAQTRFFILPASSLLTLQMTYVDRRDWAAALQEQGQLQPHPDDQLLGRVFP